MPLLLWRLLTVMLAALSMALSFCHLMEMPVRLSWEPTLWMQTTNFGGLYYLFGRIGAVIDISAIVAAAVLVFLTRHRRPSFHLTMAGAALMAVGLAVWFSLVAPMNAIMAAWTADTVPHDFVAVRNQWEHSHATIAAIKIAGLAALLLSVLVDTVRPANVTLAAQPPAE
jgi:hypothetical protein